MRQLDLGLGIGRLGAFGEDVEDEAGAVEHLDLQLLLDVGDLLGGEVVVKYHHSYLVFLDILLYLVEFPFAHECAWVGVVEFLQEYFLGHGSGRVGEESELVEILACLGLALLDRDKSHEHCTLGGLVGYDMVFHCPCLLKSWLFAREQAVIPLGVVDEVESLAVDRVKLVGDTEV